MGKTTVVFLILILVLLMTATVLTVPAYNWQTLLLANQSNVEADLSNSSLPAPELLWNYTTGGKVYSAPAVINFVVYVGSYDQNLYALNASSGAKLWSYFDGGYGGSSPAVVDGVVYMTDDYRINALNATDGTEIWSKKALDSIPLELSSPTVVDGIVYACGTGFGIIYAFDADSGAELWFKTPISIAGFGSGYTLSPPVVANGVIYLGAEGEDISHFDDANGVYALNASDGTSLWNYTTGYSVEVPPAFANGAVYAVDYEGVLHAINATSGIQLWRFNGNFESSPKVVDGVVYVGSDDGSVYALNATSSIQIWKSLTDNGTLSTPTVSDGLLFVGSSDGNVYSLNATNGDGLWVYTTSSEVGTPAIVNGVVFVGGGNNVYALNASAFAQSIPKPSVPEFTVKVEDSNAIEVTIENQPFVPYYDASSGYNISLYYDVRVRQNAEQNWTVLYLIEDVPTQTNSDYTTLSYPVSDKNTNSYILGDKILELPNGSQVDFQVEAMIGYVYRVSNATSGYPYAFAGEESGWSNTQTLTIGENPPPLTGLSSLQTAIVLAIVVAVVAAVTAGLLVYFKKHKR